MFFELFPTVNYINVGQTTSKTVTKYLCERGSKTTDKENLTVFTRHTIRSGETPESIAFDLW